MPQADITLYLLRSSCREPKLSAYACLNGNYDFYQSPLAPPGTRVVVHVTPEQRANMAPHGVDGWYVGPSTEHCRCHKCYIPSTFGVRDALTVDWFPHTVPFPKVTPDECLRQTAANLLTIIQDKVAHSIPSLTYGSTVTNACMQIAQILKRATVQPKPPLLPPVPEQRVPFLATPAPEQRVLAPAPTATPAPAKPSPPLQPKKTSTPGPPCPSRHRQPVTSRHACGPLAQIAINNKYAHHSAALVTSPPTAGKQGSLKKLLAGPSAPTWLRGLANEWGRLLLKGLGINRPISERIQGTGAIFFITKAQVPQGRKVTYANFVCNIRPHKTEIHRVRMTASGNQLDYPGDPISPTVSMLHVNSVISDAHKGARHLGLDIANCCLGTPMAYYQCMRVLPWCIPQEVWHDPNYYDIHIADDGCIYLEIQRGMCGLKEAGIIAFNQLSLWLRTYAFHPRPLASHNQTHDFRPLRRRFRCQALLQRRRPPSHRRPPRLGRHFVLQPRPRLAL
jgi:hypothetical protein